MLQELYIKNMAVIDELRMEFAAGFQVLTGETGAGKSILVEAIGLILGNKADASLIRDGAEETVVEACFEIPKNDPVMELLKSEGLENPDDATELVIRRVMTKTGKNKIFVNQQRATVSVLQKISALLIDFTGQHEQMELLDTANDIPLLDSFLADSKIVLDYSIAFARTYALKKEIDELEKIDAQKTERLEWLRFQLVEFEKLAVESPEQEEELKKQRELLRHQNTISQFETLASQILTEDEGNCLSRLNKLIQAVDKNPTLVQMFQKILPSLEEIKLKIEDVAYEIARTCNATGASGHLSLEEIEARLYHLEKLKRRFGATVEEVFQKRAELEDEQKKLKNFDQNLEKSRKAFANEFKSLQVLAQDLSKARQKIKSQLEKLVRSELEYLQMPGVSFVIEISALTGKEQDDFAKYTSRGTDRVQFLLSTNPGLSPRPLAKIASGGETSRIFLALKQVLARSRKGGTLIFDEIDTGISGAAVELVGNKLKHLAGDFQVFCVTHHAQIASKADRHYSVQKSTEKNKTITRVKTLSQPERIQEIARLMGGVNISDKNLAYARELVQSNNK